MDGPRDDELAFDVFVRLGWYAKVHRVLRLRNDGLALARSDGCVKRHIPYGAVCQAVAVESHMLVLVLQDNQRLIIEHEDAGSLQSYIQAMVGINMPLGTENSYSQSEDQSRGTPGSTSKGSRQIFTQRQPSSNFTTPNSENRQAFSSNSLKTPINQLNYNLTPFGSLKTVRLKTSISTANTQRYGSLRSIPRGIKSADNSPSEDILRKRLTLTAKELEQQSQQQKTYAYMELRKKKNNELMRNAQITTPTKMLSKLKNIDRSKNERISIERFSALVNKLTGTKAEDRIRTIVITSFQDALDNSASELHKIIDKKLVDFKKIYVEFIDKLNDEVDWKSNIILKKSYLLKLGDVMRNLSKDSFNIFWKGKGTYLGKKAEILSCVFCEELTYNDVYSENARRKKLLETKAPKPRRRENPGSADTTSTTKDVCNSDVESEYDSNSDPGNKQRKKVEKTTKIKRYTYMKMNEKLIYRIIVDNVKAIVRKVINSFVIALQVFSNTVCQKKIASILKEKIEKELGKNILHKYAHLPTFEQELKKAHLKIPFGTDSNTSTFSTLFPKSLDELTQSERTFLENIGLSMIDCMRTVATYEFAFVNAYFNASCHVYRLFFALEGSNNAYLQRENAIPQCEFVNRFLYKFITFKNGFEPPTESLLRSSFLLTNTLKQFNGHSFFDRFIYDNAIKLRMPLKLNSYNDENMYNYQRSPTYLDSNELSPKINIHSQEIYDAQHYWKLTGSASMDSLFDGLNVKSSIQLDDKEILKIRYKNLFSNNEVKKGIEEEMQGGIDYEDSTSFLHLKNLQTKDPIHALFFHENNTDNSKIFGLIPVVECVEKELNENTKKGRIAKLNNTVPELGMDEKCPVYHALTIISCIGEVYMKWDSINLDEYKYKSIIKQKDALSEVNFPITSPNKEIKTPQSPSKRRRTNKNITNTPTSETINRDSSVGEKILISNPKSQDKSILSGIEDYMIMASIMYSLTFFDQGQNGHAIATFFGLSMNIEDDSKKIVQKYLIKSIVKSVLISLIRKKWSDNDTLNSNSDNVDGFDNVKNENTDMDEYDISGDNDSYRNNNNNNNNNENNENIKNNNNAITNPEKKINTHISKSLYNSNKLSLGYFIHNVKKEIMNCNNQIKEHLNKFYNNEGEWLCNDSSVELIREGVNEILVKFIKENVQVPLDELMNFINDKYFESRAPISGLLYNYINDVKTSPFYKFILENSSSSEHAGEEGSGCNGGGSSGNEDDDDDDDNYDYYNDNDNDNEQVDETKKSSLFEEEDDEYGYYHKQVKLSDLENIMYKEELKKILYINKTFPESRIRELVDNLKLFNSIVFSEYKTDIELKSGTPKVILDDLFSIFQERKENVKKMIDMDVNYDKLVSIYNLVKEIIDEVENSFSSEQSVNESNNNNENNANNKNMNTNTNTNTNTPVSPKIKEQLKISQEDLLTYTLLYISGYINGNGEPLFPYALSMFIPISLSSMFELDLKIKGLLNSLQQAIIRVTCLFNIVGNSANEIIVPDSSELDYHFNDEELKTIALDVLKRATKISDLPPGISFKRGTTEGQVVNTLMAVSLLNTTIKRIVTAYDEGENIVNTSDFNNDNDNDNSNDKNMSYQINDIEENTDGFKVISFSKHNIKVNMVYHAFTSKMYGLNVVDSNNREIFPASASIIDVIARKLFAACLNNLELCKQLYQQNTNFFIQLLNKENLNIILYLVNKFTPYVNIRAGIPISPVEWDPSFSNITILPPELALKKDESAKNASLSPGKQNITSSYNPFRDLGKSLVSASMYSSVIVILNKILNNDEAIKLRLKMDAEILEVLLSDTERGRHFIEFFDLGKVGQPRLLCNYEYNKLLNLCIRKIDINNRARAWLFLYLVT